MIIIIKHTYKERQREEQGGYNGRQAKKKSR